MIDEIKIAMLGSGFVADFYMQGLANVAGQQVVANYSRSSKRAKSFRQRWGIAHSFSNLDDIISEWDIDLFIIALPNEEHLPVSLKLSAAGRPQVCTKPLGRNPAEAKKMLNAARKSGAMHGYAETEVFAPCVVKAREVIEQGALGKVLWVRSRESHSGPHSAHFWDVNKTGGGAMHDLGCHCIAAATAHLAAQEGWQVFIVGREEAECVSLGFPYFLGDLSEEETIDKAFAKFGVVDAVFNVVGSSGRRFGDGPIHECTLKGWEMTLAANARPAFLVSRAAVRSWLGAGKEGALLNVSSVLAFSPEPSHFATHAYAASKAAVISLSHAMAAQYASKGIRANVLAPALVRTPMSARAQGDAEISSFIEKKQPLSRGFLSAEDIAQTALFLLGEKARHITGQVITVDGGWTL